MSVTTNRNVRAVLVAALMLALPTCSGRPTGVLLPIAQTEQLPGTSRVDMLVATTRKSATDRGVLFSGERGGAVTYNAALAGPASCQGLLALVGGFGFELDQQNR